MILSHRMAVVLIVAALFFGGSSVAVAQVSDDELSKAVSDALGRWKSSLVESTERNAGAEFAGGDETLRAGNVSLDLAVPEVPAMAALDVTQETVIRPASAKELSMALLDGVDANGNLQSGLALQMSPYLVFGGSSQTLDKYRKSYYRRFLARTNLSLATAKGSSDDDEAVRLGLGLSLTPWDRGDPRAVNEVEGRFDPIACIGRSQSALNAALLKPIKEMDSDDRETLEREFMTVERDTRILGGEEQLPSPDQFDRELKEKLTPLYESAMADVPNKFKLAEQCREDFRRDSWNASAWTLGIAPTWTSTDGSLDNLEWSGAALYTTLSYGFEDIPEIEMLRKNSQLLLHARYRSDAVEADAAAPGGYFEQDTLFLGGQLRVGVDFPSLERISGADASLLGEVAYIEKDRVGGMDEESMRYSIGFQFKVTEGLYLNLSGGTEDSDMADNDETFIGLRLSYSFSDNPAEFKSLFK